MGADSRIEWCQHTFNPFIGCTKVSPGCDHCYAETWAKRSGLVVWGGERRRTSDANWRLPLKWNAQAEREGRRFRVFCASLADVFDKDVPAEWRDDLWRLIESTPNLDWLLLTKRVGNVVHQVWPRWMQAGWPANVWIGATVCNQAEADRDIPKLLEVPARVRFLSIEPMLGPINVGPYLSRTNMPGLRMMPGFRDSLPGVDWVICGGESGPKARPMHISWARDLMRQCKAAGVPAMMKQLGAQPRGWCAAQVHADEADREDGACDFYEGHELRDPCPGRCIAMVDKKGGDPAEWPEDLRVREYPHP
ncbi:MAG: phage Gp37/Gp68 family protein [Burkholderiales bacterium]|nr:phage Gp37/Gp68 family protein [Burkholderiales bacterium]